MREENLRGIWSLFVQQQLALAGQPQPVALVAVLDQHFRVAIAEQAL